MLWLTSMVLCSAAWAALLYGLSYVSKALGKGKKAAGAIGLSTPPLCPLTAALADIAGPKKGNKCTESGSPGLAIWVSPSLDFYEK